MLETILHQQEIQQLLNEKKLQTQEVQSNTVQALKVDSIVMENTCSGKENSNSELLHSKIEDLKGTRIEHGFKRAFMSLFGQDDDTFTSMMFLNVDQLQKQLGKMIVRSGFHGQPFRKVRLQKNKSSNTDDERVNKRQMQTQESKIDTDKIVDADLVVTERSGTESEVQDDNNRSWNDTDADDADIRPIYDEEPMVEVESPSGKKYASCYKKKMTVNTHEVPKADMIVMTSMIELESLFGPLFDEYFNGENQVVSKSYVVTTADASDKRQQQPDSTSSTSTLLTTVIADGNFDFEQEVKHFSALTLQIEEKSS
ncbi:hypothetical protein Tco_0931963 [Tanacetum coccineum]